MPAKRSTVKRSNPNALGEKKTTRKKTKSSQQSEEPISTIQIDENLKKNLDKIYAISLPNHVFQFWEFCKEMNSQNPLDALSAMNLKLVGPFHYMNNGSETENKEPYTYHLKWRYYYDPPEFLNLIVSTKNQFHVGGWFDDPTDSKFSVVASNSGKNEKFAIDGDDLFSALCVELESRLKVRDIKKKEIDQLSKLKESLTSFAAKCGLVDLPVNKIAKERSKKVVAKTFQQVGIVVPIVSGVGYRPLNHKNNELKNILRKIVEAKDDGVRMQLFSPLQEMVTYIQFANDECDYGMGFELGIDLFCNGSRYFHKMSSMLLCMAYKLLKRDLYSEIIQHHIADRRDKNFERK